MGICDSLYESGEAAGVARYVDNNDQSRNEARIIVQARLSTESGPTIEMVIDTAATWNVIHPELANLCRFDLSSGERSSLSTRFGSIDGVIVRHELVLIASRGNDVVVDSTFFVPDQWNDSLPNFIGYNGCLCHISFAIDPISNEVCYCRE